MNIYIICLISLLLTPFLESIKPKLFECKIIRIIDGDTLIVKSNIYNNFTLRLSYIDALEKEQGKEGDLAIEFLKKFKKKSLSCNIFAKDIYHRFLGEIRYKEESINFNLVKLGLVYLYPYSLFTSVLEKEDYKYWFKIAKQEKKGIFKFKKIMNPKKFRKLNKKRPLKNNGLILSKNKKIKLEQ